MIAWLRAARARRAEQRRVDRQQAEHVACQHTSTRLVTDPEYLGIGAVLVVCVDCRLHVMAVDPAA